MRRSLKRIKVISSIVTEAVEWRYLTALMTLHVHTSSRITSVCQYFTVDDLSMLCKAGTGIASTKFDINLIL